MPRNRDFIEEEVLDKAVNLFWKQGYYSTSMQDVVDALGINRASLYNTFGDKRSLFEKALKRYQEVNRKQLQDFLDKQSSIKEGLKKLLEMAIGSPEDKSNRKGCLMVNTTTEFLPEDEYIRVLMAKNKVSMEDIFLGFLTRGLEIGEISKNLDVESVACLLFTHYNGIKVISKINKNKEDLIRSIPIVLSVLD